MRGRSASCQDSRVLIVHVWWNPSSYMSEPDESFLKELKSTKQ